MALASLVQDLLMLAVPHGGQEVARRNAWASMSAGSARARGRREADEAMAVALATAARRGARHSTGS